MTFTHPDYVIAATVQIPNEKLSMATLGRKRLNPAVLADLAYLFACQPEDIAGWADDGDESPLLTAELPCIESGIDTDVPPHTPYWVYRRRRLSY